MPRSSSARPSDSSHDSESPIKRAPSVDEDVNMDIDIERYTNSPPARGKSCEHLQSLTSSDQMLSHYEKALKWSTSAHANTQHRAKRRRVCPVISFASLLSSHSNADANAVLWAMSCATAQAANVSGVPLHRVLDAKGYSGSLEAVDSCARYQLLVTISVS